MIKVKQTFGFTALMIATFLGTLDSTIVNIALPDITTSFKTSLNNTSWISTIYVLSLSVFMITASKLADQFGRKKLMLIGLSVFGLSSFLCGLSRSLLFLTVIRFCQGIGAAIITPVGLPMGLEILGKEKRQFVVGAAGAIISIAAASGPPLGGVLVQYFGWQSIFFVNVPLCLIAIVLTALFVQESYDSSVSKKIDWLGIVFITISLFSLIFALLDGGSLGWNSVLIITMFIVCVVSIGLFIFTEAKVKNPMLELHLFKESTFTASSLCYMMVGFGITSTMLIFNYFLENLLGYSALKAALVIIFISITSAFSVPSGSLIAKRIGTRPVNFAGIFLMGIGVFILSRLNISATRAEMIVALIVFGVGLGFAGQAIASAIKFLPQEKSGIASGVINAFRQVGTCLGVAILVSILNVNMIHAAADIKNDALADIDKQPSISDVVKTQLIHVVNNLDSSSNLTPIEIQAMAQNDSTEEAVISNIVKDVIRDKNEKTSGAYSNTFLFSALILIVASISGIFTDRKQKNGDFH